MNSPERTEAKARFRSSGRMVGYPEVTHELAGFLRKSLKFCDDLSFGEYGPNTRRRNWPRNRFLLLHILRNLGTLVAQAYRRQPGAVRAAVAVKPLPIMMVLGNFPQSWH